MRRAKFWALQPACMQASRIVLPMHMRRTCHEVLHHLHVGVARHEGCVHRQLSRVDGAGLSRGDAASGRAGVIGGG